MKRLLWASMLVGSLGMAPIARPADATVVRCASEAVDECDGDFPGESENLIAIRGWCYMIRTAICWWF
jgi:hypothetical protein